jgi:hypothetical protein
MATKYVAALLQPGQPGGGGADGGGLGEQAGFFFLLGEAGEFDVQRVSGVEEAFLAMQYGRIVKKGDCPSRPKGLSQGLSPFSPLNTRDIAARACVDKALPSETGPRADRNRRTNGVLATSPTHRRPAIRRWPLAVFARG